MSTKGKRIGSTWEHDLVELLEKYLDYGKFKRIPGSGAFGTRMGESILTGDINGEIKGLPSKVKIEAKCGYGEKEMTIKKEWLDKILSEADASYSIPMLMGKFSNVRSGVKYFAVIDFFTFVNLMNHISEMKRELDLVYDEYHKVKEELNKLKEHEE